jgi:hypothetical protein
MGIKKAVDAIGKAQKDTADGISKHTKKLVNNKLFDEEEIEG